MRITLKPRGNKFKELDGIEIDKLTEVEIISKSVTEIPTELLHSGITKIQLLTPKMSIVPETFSNMVNLKFLRLKNAPEVKELSHLHFKNLEEVYLSGLSLSEFPHFISESALSIQVLDLHGNKISEVPNYVHGMDKLKRLILDSNNIDTFLLTKEGLTSLLYLSLDNNPFSEEEKKRIESVFKITF